MKKSILSIVACFLMVSMAVSQSWVGFTKATPEAPIVNVTRSGNQSVKFTVEACGMYKQNITEAGITYQRISVPASGTLTITGAPELPAIRKLVAIPECTGVSLNVSILGQLTLSNYNVYPVPAFQEAQDVNGGKFVEEVFSKDATVYANNGYLPGVNAEIVSTGYLRDQKYAEVLIYPVQFNPVTGQITVYTKYDITLSFTNPSTAVNVNTGIFNNVAANTMLNYISSGITASVNDNIQGNGNVQWITLTNPSQADDIVADYLIICAEEFFEPNNPNSEVLRIANHRASYNGFDVAILNSKTIYFDLDFEYTQEEYIFEQKLRSCIRRIYEGTNAHHTYDGKLGYVLLIGDSEYPTNLGMPTSYDSIPGASIFGDPYPSDYYYSCLTSDAAGIYDEVGDLYIGRFSVDNNLQNGLTELHNIVSKTIYYESEATFGGWRDETGVLIDENFDIYIQPYFNFIDNLVPSYFTVDKIDANLPGTHQKIFDIMNDGVSTFTYFGHGLKHGWSAGGYLDMSDLKDSLTNYNKPPVVHAIACETGWFDKNTDCFGESLTTYSETDGFTGYFGAGRIAQGSHGNTIANPPNEIQAYIQYAIFHNLSHVTGEYILESKLMSGVADDKFAFNYFGDPAMNIMAQGFEVTHTIGLPLNTTISTKITVKNGATLFVPSQCRLNFEGNGSLVINEGANLSIMSGAEVKGNLEKQSIEIIGDFFAASNVTFLAKEGEHWGGVKLNNLSKNYILNGIRFENSMLKGESNNLNLKNSSFLNSSFKYKKGNVLVENTSFDNSDISLTFGASKSSSVRIKSGCTIKNCKTEPAIYIEGYPQYEVDGCLITNNAGDGLSIYNSGGIIGDKIVSNNTITHNGWNMPGAGITLFHSYSDISGNQKIEGNKYGILSLNYSNVKIIGNESAQFVSETQKIANNEINQVYATQGSFPFYFKWNAIIDEDNSQPLIYFVTPVIGPNRADVRDNYWGNNFNPNVDLYPFDKYVYLPVWELQESNFEEEVEILYNSAHQKISQEDYIGAKSDFQQIINDYPLTQFSLASMRELFVLEEYSTNNYNGLIDYFNGDTTIQNQPELKKLSDYLVNFCAIKLENYPTAITWFEDIILQPETVEDSIFAMIDLGYTYLLMENDSLKSFPYGKMPELKPDSRAQFELKREFLLNLLFRTKEDTISFEHDKHLNTSNRLLQNYPNPFVENTQIWYKTEENSTVDILISDLTGKKIRTIKEGTKEKGMLCIDLQLKGISPGTYFYTLIINGRICDTKKMTKLN